jgi:hypothetical protein
MNDRVRLTRFAERYAEAWCSQNQEGVAAFFAENGSISINNGRRRLDVRRLPGKHRRS